MLKIKAVCACHTGKVRTNNEDNFYFNGLIMPEENQGLPNSLSASILLNKPACFGVFDGMGGEAYGETASYIAAKTLKEYAANHKINKKNLLAALFSANKRICTEAKKRTTALMGTTAVVLGFAAQGACIVNVGDSKAFLWRDGILRQISVDHTDQKLLAMQGITKRKPRLTQNLGIEPEEMVIEPYAEEIQTEIGDCFLLCSDGLTDMVSEREIQNILVSKLSNEENAQNLLQAALANGGRDNITIILCNIENK